MNTCEIKKFLYEIHSLFSSLSFFDNSIYTIKKKQNFVRQNIISCKSRDKCTDMWYVLYSIYRILSQNDGELRGDRLDYFTVNFSKFLPVLNSFSVPSPVLKVKLLPGHFVAVVQWILSKSQALVLTRCNPRELSVAEVRHCDLPSEPVVSTHSNASRGS